MLKIKWEKKPQKEEEKVIIQTYVDQITIMYYLHNNFLHF